MEKLKLDLDALQVDSFQTSRPAREAEGTVRAHQASVVSACSCEATVFTTRCYDNDGDTDWDSWEPGPTDYCNGNEN